ncbi:MAG: hypothetical protein HXY24_13610, partial [Rubrivivax sp.]|nr:hypothetical protein [Rubrivivax sp.]
VLVSHDRHLLRATCDELWLVANGKVTPFDGDLDDYADWLSQSRAAIVSLVAATLVWFVFASVRNVARATLAALTAAAVVLAAWPFVSRTVSQWGPVRGMITRTTAGDPTGGRMEKFDRVLVIVDRNPVVGGGFKTIMTPVENGYVSLAVETGYLGVAIYLVLVAVVVGKALQLRARSADDAGRRLGEWLIVLTTFMLVRSMGERSHPLQMGDALSNAWLLYAGYLLVLQPLREAPKPRGLLSRRRRKSETLEARPPQ